MADGFGSRFDKFVGVDRPPTLMVSAFQTAEFVATRVQWEWAQGGHPTLFDRADGYMICVQRIGVSSQPYWADQRSLALPPMRPGEYLLLDLGVQHSSLVPGDVDCISIYTSRDALLQYQAENDLALTGELLAPLCATHQDAVVQNLCEALLPAIEKPATPSQLWVDHVALALLSRLTAQHGVGPKPLVMPRGGLAAWQERRAKDVLIANLDGGISLEALAVECRLSRSHFARAFKVSTGVSPFRWLSLQRIERAKVILLNSNLPIEQVAAACGFADASHFARAFQQAVGLAPGAWRRARRS